MPHVRQWIPHRITPLMTRRILARMADLACMVVMAAVLPGPLGALAAFAYSLLGDGLERLPWGRLPPESFWQRVQERVSRHPGQSVGKVLFHLRVISVRAGGDTSSAHPELTLRQSAVRNLPFGIMTFFLFIPLWGWLLAFLVGVPLLALEAYLMIRVPRAQRLGDALAQTEVVGLIG